MATVTILLAIIGAAFVLLISFMGIVGWLNDRSEKRAYKRRKDAFEYVARNIDGCKYWLGSDERKPFMEMFSFMVDSMKNYHNVSANELRKKVDQIIRKYNP